MKWLVVMVIALVLGAAGAFAVYAWVGQDDDSARSEADERAVAEVYARHVAEQCARFKCRAENLHRIAPGLWGVMIVVSKDKTYCAAIRLDQFGLTADGGFTGVANVSCV